MSPSESPKEYIFNQEAFNDLRGPIVYILFREENIYYIGSSKVGLSRAFSSAHSCKAMKDIHSGYNLKVISCKTIWEARALESKLIKQHFPKYNMYGTMFRFATAMDEDVKDIIKELVRA